MFTDMPVLFGSGMFTTGYNCLTAPSVSMYLRAGNYNSINATKIK